MVIELLRSTIFSRSDSMERDRCGRQSEVYIMWYRGVLDGKEVANTYLG